MHDGVRPDARSSQTKHRRVTLSRAAVIVKTSISSRWRTGLIIEPRVTATSPQGSFYMRVFRPPRKIDRPRDNVDAVEPRQQMARRNHAQLDALTRADLLAIARYDFGTSSLPENADGKLFLRAFILKGMPATQALDGTVGMP